MLLSLLHLLDIDCGSIIVDGVDLEPSLQGHRAAQMLRHGGTRPFLLPESSLYFNLDPSMAIDGAVLVGVLEKIGLKDHFSMGPCADVESYENQHAQDANDFLRKPLCSLPALSSSQAQLRALGRAVVQAAGSSLPDNPRRARYSDGAPKPVILLDEVTSLFGSNGGSHRLQKSSRRRLSTKDILSL